MLDLLKFIPEVARNKIRDTIVDGIYSASKDRLDDKYRNTIRSLRTNGTFLNAFDNALAKALARFTTQYQDLELTQALVSNPKFWTVGRVVNQVASTFNLGEESFADKESFLKALGQQPVLQARFAQYLVGEPATKKLRGGQFVAGQGLTIFDLFDLLELQFYYREFSNIA